MRAEQHVSVPRCGQLAVLSACRARGARFAVAQDARMDDPGLATIRNPRNVGFNQTSKWSGAALEVVQHIGSRKRHHNVSLAAVVAQAWLLPNPSIPPPPRSHEYFRRLACWLDFREFSIWPHWSS